MTHLEEIVYHALREVYPDVEEKDVEVEGKLKQEYLGLASNAMQGLLEMGGTLGKVVDTVVPVNMIADKAFEIADAMMRGYIKRVATYNE